MSDPDEIPLDVYHELRLRRRDAIWEHGTLQDCDRTLGAFIVCPTCGNKRCPHASDHDYACTNSNEAGQAGSVYE